MKKQEDAGLGRSTARHNTDLTWKERAKCLHCLLSWPLTKATLRRGWPGHKLRWAWRSSQMALTDGQWVLSWKGSWSVHVWSVFHICKELLIWKPGVGKKDKVIIKMLWLWSSIWNWGISKNMEKYARLCDCFSFLTTNFSKAFEMSLFFEH
jgi:hypothetical protein